MIWAIITTILGVVFLGIGFGWWVAHRADIEAERREIKAICDEFERQRGR